MTILTDIIPARARKYVLYAPYALIGLVFGAWGVFAGAVETYSLPDWYLGFMAVYGFVGTALSLTAYANASGTRPDDQDTSVTPPATD
jgi:ABC-type multidrug transport system permease subunit